MKAVQYFTDEYLERCREMTLDQRVQFLEDFRKLQERKVPTQLISLKVPGDLLQAFKKKCSMNGEKYQTKIKDLMYNWVSEI